SDALSVACQGLPRPDLVAANGGLDWDVVRKAYRANLQLVWDAVLQLAASDVCQHLEVVVTSDHGEILGEYGGQFGHEAAWPYRELFEVPWLALKAEHREANRSGSTVESKLKALGYV
ncbi:MAG: hypothetical protein KAX44_09390, partial [Candidatus Brocadiae bacterium]|nr:hypothetical protein [Candidatus Brocadiia bacterium]